MSIQSCMTVLLCFTICSLTAEESGQPAPTIDMSQVVVTASSYESKAHGGFRDHPPSLAVDGDFSGLSSWRAEGHGEWIQCDLQQARELSTIFIAFHGAKKRRYTFEVQVSNAAADDSWQTVVRRQQSVEGSLAAEPYQFTAQTARYIRIVGYGNTHAKWGEWINVVEIGLR